MTDPVPLPNIASPPLAASAPDRASPARFTPLCFVVDQEASIRHFISLMLQGSGIETEEYADGAAFRAALGRHPDLVFVDVPIDASDATETINALERVGYAGAVQVMGSRASIGLESVKEAGEKAKLRMLPALKKPFDTGAIQKIIASVKIAPAPAVAARIKLHVALDNGWIEFWYQPKIDLRRKQLIGAEAYARAKHPQHGVLAPDAFLPGTDEASLIRLGELAITNAIRAERHFATVGVSLRLAVNIDFRALTKLPVEDIVRSHLPDPANWPGLVIDVTEDQAIAGMDVAAELDARFRPHNVKLAIDHFGRAYSSLLPLKQIPFAEMKIDRSFVVDCGTDKVNAPICKTVIDLAHNFGCAAVATGIEKAADSVALTAMGCDYGQGFLLGQPMPEERLMSLLRQRAAAGSKKSTAAANPA